MPGQRARLGRLGTATRIEQLRRTATVMRWLVVPVFLIWCFGLLAMGLTSLFWYLGGVFVVLTSDFVNIAWRHAKAKELENGLEVEERLRRDS